MTWTPDKIPTWLRRTPEQQANDRAYQEALRTAQGPGRRLSPTERQLLRANAVRLSAEAHLRHLQTDPEARPEHIQQAAAQLAEALADQGYFQEAAELHPHPERRARYQAIAAAVERDDNEPACDCAVEVKTDPQSGRQITLQNQVVRKMVFSQKHGTLMPLVECVKCGDLNVKAAPQPLEARIDAVRREHNAARRTTKTV